MQEPINNKDEEAKMKNKKETPDPGGLRQNTAIRWIVALAWSVLPVALFIVACIYAKRRYDTFLQNKGTLTAQGITYANIELLISAGIGIVALAVSVWIGLNIYNALSKREIEERINRKEQEIDERLLNGENRMNDSRYKLQSQLQAETDRKLRIISKYSLFLETLYIAHDDKYKSLSDYFYDKFSHLRVKDLETITESQYSQLIDMEKTYNAMWRFYDDSAWRQVEEYAGDLKTHLEQAYEEIKNIEKEPEEKNRIRDELRKLLKEYYYAREASAYSCLLFCLKNGSGTGTEEDIKTQYWSKFWNNCVALLKLKGMPVEKKFEASAAVPDDPFDRAFIAVLYNLLGYTAHSVKKLPTAVCIQLVSNAAKLEPENATFHNNLGTLYQNCWNHEGNTDSGKKNYESAMSEYAQVKRYNSHEARAYNNMSALILKKLDMECMTRGGGDCFRSFSEISKDLKKNQSGELQQNKDEVEKAIIYLLTATRIEPTFVDSYFNLGKAYYYRYLLNGSYDKQDYERSITECRIAQNINPEANGWKYVLRNIYELHDPEKAWELNTELHGNGDSEKWKEMFKREKLEL